MACCENCDNRCSDACDYEYYDEDCENEDDCPADGCDDYDPIEHA